MPLLQGSKGIIYINVYCKLCGAIQMEGAVIVRYRQIKILIHFYHCQLSMVRKELFFRIRHFWLERDFLLWGDYQQRGKDAEFP